MSCAPANAEIATASDTIAAIATAPGAVGGIGIVRLSGLRSADIACALIGKKLKPRIFHFAAFHDAAGVIIDRGLAVRFVAPQSYTGEDIVELHAHGSPVVLSLLLQRVLALGARPARPGEFSERAFFNGKLDLTQAEAVADLIASGSEAAARAAMRSLEGEFSAAVREIFNALVRLRAWLEAALDFPEEDFSAQEQHFLAAPELSRNLTDLQQRVADLLAAARRGVRLRDGLHVVIVGRPNAGKSSLLNALAQSDRAIVTEIAGTTRDVLREDVNFDGIALTLVDTAGLRDSTDAIEAEGMRRARAELARADVAILVADSTRGEAHDALLAECPADATRLVVYNKIDLVGTMPHRQKNKSGEIHIYLSARNGAGLDLLRAELKRLSGLGEGAHGAFSARARHVEALQKTNAQLAAAAEQLRAGVGELAAEALRLAQRGLGEITGEYTSDELLGEIFSSFCIGK